MSGGTLHYLADNATQRFGEGVNPEGLSYAATWGWAFLFVSIINLSSVMGIIFFPLMKKSFYTLLMRTMIGLAIGSLSGSSLFHLIPAAFDLHETNEKGQRYLNIAVFIWGSIWFVMLLECTIKIVVKLKNERSMKKFQTKCVTAKIMNDKVDLEGQVLSNGAVHSTDADEDIHDDTEENDDDGTPRTTSIKTSHGNLPIYRSTLSLSKSVIDALHDENSPPETIKTVAWIVIIGDSLHNFVDGVSIGAGFVKDFRTGAVISLAIICEEFPHELGDFAILISSGFTVKAALGVNFLSALTCYLGMGMGILLGEIEWSNYIFAFAAGIFLYVSLADMVPEIMSLVEDVCEVNPKKAWKVLLTHNLGILVGISILYLLAVFQPQ